MKLNANNCSIFIVCVCVSVCVVGTRKRAWAVKCGSKMKRSIEGIDLPNKKDFFFEILSLYFCSQDQRKRFLSFLNVLFNVNCMSLFECTFKEHNCCLQQLNCCL